jgi:hypothetical protein
MAISTLYISHVPSAVFQILPRVSLPLPQVAAFALHFVVGLSALSAGSLLSLPG